MPRALSGYSPMPTAACFIRQMSEKMAKYHTKKLHQEELMTEKKAKHAEEARNRHLQAAHKEAVRTERKQKAVEVGP